jgi:hypothetical protein
MSILNANKIDLIGIDKKTNNAILTISDHLDWDDEHYHLSALQEKINSYLKFIESDEIYQVYPNAIGKKLIIEIVGKYELTKAGLNFIGEVEMILNEINIELYYNVKI